MNTNNFFQTDFKIFTTKALFWMIGLGSFSLLMALAGFFYGSLVAFTVGCAAVFIAPKVFKQNPLKKISREFLIAGIVISLAVIVLSFYTNPTIFSGRDQGAFSEAAIRLTQNHQLEFKTAASEEFFKIYGPGKALNFPGFYYTQDGQLISQFPLAYISYLATFYAWFGIYGLTIANAILGIFFLFSFYTLLRKFVNIKFAATGTLLMYSSFPFVWFFKFTLTEMMALPLLWFGILQLAHFKENPEKLSYFSALLAFGLLALTRIEGYVFFAIAALIVFHDKNCRRFILKHRKTFLFYPVTILFAVFIWNFISDSAFYREIARATLKTATEKNNDAGNISGGSLITLFALYSILGFFVIGLIGSGKAIYRKNYHLLLPGLIIAPTLVYLIDPNISQDHPWMLRRFTFSLLPAAIFYTIYFLASKEKESREKTTKIFVTAITMLLFAGNIFVISPYFFHRENANLLEQGRTITKDMTEKDLILMSPSASGNQWAMLAGPLSAIDNKNAVYFFNPNDLDKIDINKFENIYLVSNNDDLQIYSSIQDRLIPLQQYSIEINGLDNKEMKNFTNPNLPEITEKQISGVIFQIKK